MTKKSIKFSSTVSLSWDNGSLISINDDYTGALKSPSTEKPHLSGLGTVPEGEAQNLSGIDTQIGLLVRIDATHAGIVTENNGLYLPAYMRDAVGSFTENYNKPVLIHHDTNNDPVGRILSAEYVDTSGVASASARDSASWFSKNFAFAQDFISGKMPYGMQVDAMRKLFMDKVSSDKPQEALGHISVLANITDSSAIQKILDGRYLTCSTSVNSDKATCSVCRQDWVADGMCEHKPGKSYEDGRCFLITGKLWYDELSFVNVPADRYSKVSEVVLNDSVQSFEDSCEHRKSWSVSVGFPQYDLKEFEMKTKDSKSNKEAATEAKDQDTVKIEDAEKTPGGEETTKTEDSIKKEDSTEETKKNEVNNLSVLIGKMIDSTITKDESLELYDMQVLELEALAEELDGEFSIEDVKLSAEKRRKLSASSFCGPNRSFPVHDCAHVVAAKRLLGKYKGEGDKSGISVCIDRKDKAMGCSSDKKKKKKSKKTSKKMDDSVKTEDNTTRLRAIRSLADLLSDNEYATKYDESTSLSDEELTMLQETLVIMSKLVGKDSLQSALENSDLAVSNASMDSVLAEVVTLEINLGELRDQTKALQAEYSDVQTDLVAMRKAFVDEQKSHQKDLLKFADSLAKLSGQEADHENLASMDSATFSDYVSKMLDDIDSGKFVDNLKKDGMANEPSGETFTAEDAVLEEESETETDHLIVPTMQDLKHIEETFWGLAMRDRQEAKRYLDGCKSKFDLSKIFGSSDQ